jgi:Ion channel
MQKLGLRQQTGEHFRKLRERSSDQLLTALTIMLAVLLFVAAPMQAKGVIAAHYFGIAFVLVMVATIFIISGSMLAVVAVTITIVLAVVSTVLRLRQPSIVDVYLEASGWMISGVTLSVVVARAVFAPGRVTYHRIIGAVLLYLSIGFTFIALYTFVALLVPNAFTGLGPLRDNLAVASNFVYFSFVTLTSVGYGDIVPVDEYARSLANVEAIIGQFYPATLLARIVTLEIEDRRKR